MMEKILFVCFCASSVTEVGFPSVLSCISLLSPKLTRRMDVGRTCANVGWSVVDDKAMPFSILCRLLEQSVRKCVQPSNMSIKQLSTITSVDGSRTLRTHFKNSWLNIRRSTGTTEFGLTISDCVFLVHSTRAI